MAVTCKSNMFYSPFILERALKDVDIETTTDDYANPDYQAAETIQGKVEKKRTNQIDTLGKERTLTRSVFYTNKTDLLKDDKITMADGKFYIITEETNTGVYILS